jgi:hypothetical protein
MIMNLPAPVTPREAETVWNHSGPERATRRQCANPGSGFATAQSATSAQRAGGRCQIARIR